MIYGKQAGPEFVSVPLTLTDLVAKYTSDYGQARLAELDNVDDSMDDLMNNPVARRAIAQQRAEFGRMASSQYCLVTVPIDQVQPASAPLSGRMVA